MNKIIISGIVVAVAILGYVYTKNTDTSLENNTVPGAQGESNSKKMAFSEFLKQGGSYTCTVNQDVGGVQTAGIVYIHKDKIKGMFESVIQGVKTNTFFVVRDGYTYTWSSAYPMGFRAPLESGANTQGVSAPTGSFSWNASEIGDYNCAPWSPDESVFIVPANVQFMTAGDMGGMLQR